MHNFHKKLLKNPYRFYEKARWKSKQEHTLNNLKGTTNQIGAQTNTSVLSQTPFIYNKTKTVLRGKFKDSRVASERFKY